MSSRTPFVPAVCAVALLALTVQAAPAPLFKARQRSLTSADLVGTWTLYWGNQRGTVTLGSDGDYRCEWGGMKFVGTWSLDREGRWLIRESTTPADWRSFRDYVIRFEPG